MKKVKALITGIFILFGLVGTVNARENESAMSTTLIIKGVASGLHVTTVNPLAGIVIISSVAYFFKDDLFYEGLQNESIEVLAGQYSLNEQPALSEFKEKLVNESELIEEDIFINSGEVVNIGEWSDEDISRVALAISIQE